MRKKEDMQMGYAHGKNKVHSMGYMGGSQMVMPMGYMGGNQMVMPMGYSYGNPAVSYANEFGAASKEEQEEIAKIRAPEVIEAVVAPKEENAMVNMAGQTVGKEVGKQVTDNVTEKLGETIAQEGVKGAAASAAADAAGGAVGSLAGNLLTKGEISEEDLAGAAMQAGLTAVAGPLGAMAAPFMKTIFGSADGTTDVPPVDYKPLPSGGVADLLHSQRTQEQNVNAQKELEERIKEGLKEPVEKKTGPLGEAKEKAKSKVEAAVRDGKAISPDTVQQQIIDQFGQQIIDQFTPKEIVRQQIIDQFTPKGFPKSFKDGSENVEDFVKTVAVNQLEDAAMDFVQSRPEVMKKVSPLLMAKGMKDRYEESQIPLGTLLGQKVRGGEEGLFIGSNQSQVRIGPDGKSISYQLKIPL